MWTNLDGTKFESKADAFDWLNTTQPNPDNLYLFCDGEKMYAKTGFGIWDYFGEGYIKGLLPVERY